MIMRGNEHAHSWLTLKEAAVLASIPEKTIRHELAGRIIRHPRGSSHSFRPREIFFLKVVAELPFELSRKDRRDLYEVLTKREESRGAWVRGSDRLTLKGGVETDLHIGAIRREVVESLRIFRRGSRRVEVREEIGGGEPVFSGTRIPIRHVGQLVRRGRPPAELREDFPGLTDEDFAFARLFVELGKPPGRPKRKRLKFRRPA